MSNHFIRCIAFYLPQFHPIPENDQWWGKGFTEWTNVSKAKPLFKGHRQPKFPADLGYYDLRVTETREAQAVLARNAGLEGFCYWHYWFGHGKKLLERPFNEVLNSGKPNFPFCLAWANQTWTGIWHGRSNDILIKQDYGGVEDYIQHFNYLLPAFQDNRYILVDGKPLFIVYNPWDIPDPLTFTTTWNELALREGFPGIYFIAMDSKHSNLQHYGMNASVPHEPVSHIKAEKTIYDRIKRRLGINERPGRYSYKKLVDYLFNVPIPENQYPVLIPNWDNTPRSGRRGIIYEGSTPELFGKMFEKAMDLVKSRNPEQRIIFIKSWNEWAEGNYLEPDTVFGHGYLEQIRQILNPKK